MLQNLPPNALDQFLPIFNDQFNSTIVPDVWISFKIIPNPKTNSHKFFRPITLSLALCDVIEHKFKNRIDWWQESNSISE